MNASNPFAERVIAHYFQELDSRFSITSAASTPLTISTLLVAADATILLGLSRPFSALEFLVLMPTLANLCLIAVAFYHLARLHAGYVYDHTGTMGDFVEQRDIYALIGPTGETADDWAARSIIEQYAKCATVNAKNNEKKAWHLHRCWGWLLAASASFAVCAGAYVNHAWQQPLEVSK